MYRLIITYTTGRVTSLFDDKYAAHTAALIRANIPEFIEGILINTETSEIIWSQNIEKHHEH